VGVNKFLGPGKTRSEMLDAKCGGESHRLGERFVAGLLPGRVLAFDTWKPVGTF